MEWRRRYLSYGRSDSEHDLHGELHDSILLDYECWERWQGESQQCMEKQRRDCPDHRSANHGLSLQQLDWHGHGRLFRCEQSGLYYNERGDNGDSRFYS